MNCQNDITGILVVGSTGYIGSHLCEYYKSMGIPMVGTTRDKRCDNYFCLENPNLEFLKYSQVKFSHAVICAAIPSIAYCENNPQKTFSINVIKTLDLAQQLIEMGIKPTLFSTDVVFDGKEDLYVDDSKPCPINEYGFQKYFLEEALSRLFGKNYLLIRLSKTFSLFEKDHTLIHEISMKLFSGKTIYASQDLIFNPILINDAVQLIYKLQKENAFGLFNLSGLESTSWWELSLKIAEALCLETNKIIPVSIDSCNDGIARPKKIRLVPKKILSLFPGFDFTTIDFTVSQLKKLYLQKPLFKG